MTKTLLSLFVALSAVLALAQEPARRAEALASAEMPIVVSRLKDIASLQGPVTEPVVGYGLVVGLNKTGDRRQTVFSAQTLANMLERFGVAVPAGGIKIENVAAVLVTSEIGPYAQTGSRLDVTASSIGDAKSLQGGTLLPTPLRGPDGSIVALAQGPLSIGGFSGGSGGNTVSVNHLTVGRVPGGALVQVARQTALPTTDVLRLTMREPDFISAGRVAKAINMELGASSARVSDPGTIVVNVPQEYQASVSDLVARLEPLPIAVDSIARVVINERTGTVVLGGDVRIGPVAVAHGNLSVRVATDYQVSQPEGFSRGETTVTPQSQVDVDQEDRKLIALEPGTTLADVVRALEHAGRHAARHHRHHAGAEGCRRTPRRGRDSVSIEASADIVERIRTERGEGKANSEQTRARLTQLAAEFESMLLLQMLKEMRKSGSWADEDENADGYGAQTMLETIDVELASHLSKVQGFGLAKQMLKALGGDDEPAAAGPILSDPPEISIGEPRTHTVEMPEGHVTGEFGWRRDPINGAATFHRGIDIRAAYGQDIQSAGSGRVVSAGTQRGYGETVVIEHAGGLRTRYAHLSASLVTPGQEVAAGQVVGRAGRSGRATGTHLHFEVITATGDRMDPAVFSRFKDGEVVADLTGGTSPASAPSALRRGRLSEETRR